MLKLLMPALAAAPSVAVQDALVSDLQNFLARVVRNLVRLGRGNETLIVVVLILLLVIYLYLRKA